MARPPSSSRPSRCRRRCSCTAAGLPALLAIAVLDALANVLFAAATREGLLSLVSVAGSLYPVATIVLARVVLAERLVRLQKLGVGLALGGVAMIAAG